MGLLRAILILLLFASVAYGEDLTPDIAVLPSASVRVGEEVVFNAEGTTYTPDQTLVRRGRYEWDFGDGYIFKNPMSAPYNIIRPNGLALSHYFMKPGTFTVTLTVKIWSVFSDAKDTYPCVAAGCASGQGLDVTPDASGTTTTEITVTGKEPLTGFEIEHAPFYNRSKQYVYVQVPAAYRSASYTLKVFTIDTTADPDVSTTLLSKNNPGAEESVTLDHAVLTAGHSYILRAQLVDGTDTQVVDGSQEGIFEAFFTTPTTAQVTTIDENNTFSFNGNKVFPLYTFMTHSSAPEVNQWATVANSWHTFNSQGDSAAYTAYIDAYAAVDPTIMAIGPGRGSYQEDQEGTVYPPKNKRNHILSGITEYTNAAKDKATLFMIAIQDEPNMGASWEKALTPTLAAWQYAANSADPSHPTQVGFQGQEWLQNSTASYNDFQGSALLFGGKKWAPTTMGYDVFAASSVARFHGGTNVCNRVDMGPWWAYLAGKDRMRSFNARTSKASSTDYKDYRELIPMTGAIKPCANGIQKIIDSDSHTIGTGLHTFTVDTYQNIVPGMEVSIGRNDTITSLMTHRMFGTVSSYNYLTGTMSVNITKTEGSGTYTKWQLIVESPKHIAGETTYQAWLEVVHGSKGLLWFQYFDRPSMQISEMSDFKTKITALWPYLSGPVPSATVTDDSNVQLNRVDTMIREAGGKTYIVAVRVTEPPPEAAIAWVKLNGTPSTVVTNGKVRDENNVVWSLPPSVTIGGDGTIMAMVTADTLGDVVYVPYGMTTIETPTDGWTSVENGYHKQVILTDYSYEIPSTYPSTSTFTINVGAGLDFTGARFIRIARNDSAATRLTNYIWGNYVSYNSETGVLTYILTNYKGGGTFTNWIVETEWYQQVVGATRYVGEEPTSLTTTFALSGRCSGSETVTVYGEGRTINATDGVFTDTFAKNAVHIYTLDGAPADTTDPVIGAFTIPATSDSLTVAVSSFTCTDETSSVFYCVTDVDSSSGCSWTDAAPASFAFSTEGEKTLYAWCKDYAGNVVDSATTDTVTITLVDVTPPEVSAFTIPETSESYIIAISSFTCTDAVGVTGYCLAESDDSSGCNWMGAAHTQYSFSAEGEKTLYAFCKDLAGNVSSSAHDTTTVTLGTYTVTVTDGTGCDNGNAGSISVTKGEMASVDILAENGYYISSVTGCDGTWIGATDKYEMLIDLVPTESCTITSTCTMTPTSTGLLHLGSGGTINLSNVSLNYNIGTSNTSGNAVYLAKDRADCWSVSSPQSGTLNTAWVMHNNTSSATAKVCVYSNDGDAPDNGDSKIGCSGAITSSSVAWSSAAMDGGSVTASQNYYMCIFVDDDSTNLWFVPTKDTNDTTIYYRSGSGFYDSPPATLTGGWNIDTSYRPNARSVYVTIQ